jgi:hypothetical protein
VSETCSPGSIRLELSESWPLLFAGVSLLGLTAAALLASPLAGLPSGLLVLAVTAVGGQSLWHMRHGRHPGAWRCIEWQGGDRWTLWRGDGRARVARLHPDSRRIGEAVLFIFRRGRGDGWSTCWLLVLPHMVSDPAALRRVRARMTLEGAAMRGLGTP